MFEVYSDGYVDVRRPFEAGLTQFLSEQYHKCVATEVDKNHNRSQTGE